MARKRFDWRLRRRTLALGERTLLMAIVNVTPDSFSGDGLGEQAVHDTAWSAVARLDIGADILDLGAESTRPGAEPLSADGEQERLLPVLEAVLRERPNAIVSIDTYHAATARAALRAGAEIVNDVSGLLWDQGMAAVVAEAGCGLVLMHTRGRPQEWRTQPRLAAEAVAPLVLEELRERVDAAVAAGIAAESIVLDPGFGFGKRGAENFPLLAGFDRFGELGRPLLAGLSRKGFLREAVDHLQYEGVAAAADLLNATTAANVAAILAGAHIVRVHDLQGAREAAAVADAVLGAANSEQSTANSGRGRSSELGA
jgi:dihydropteroate synthase